MFDLISILEVNRLSGDRNWLYNSIKSLNKEDFNQNKLTIKNYLKTLDLDSSEISLKLYSLSKHYINN